MSAQRPDDQQHDEDEDTAFWARLEYILNTCIAGLTPEDVAERTAWCQRTGEHGVHVEEADATGEAVRLVWGGRPLAVVPRRVFAPDAMLEGLAFTALPAAPDDASDLG